MDIKKALLKGHSIFQARKIIDYVGDSSIRFKVLIELFLVESYRISQRAAWPLTYTIEAHPHLVSPYLTKVLKMLRKPDVPDAVKRNVMRFLQFIDIPPKHQGTVAQHCFTFLSDPKVAIAIRVFSITVLANIAKDKPDLRKELRIILEDEMPYGTAAFRSRARKTLNEITKNE